MLAALDIGTNTVLLLIAEGEPPRVLVDRSRIVRLGEGVDRTGALAEGAIARTLEALRGYAAEIRTFRARARAVGTQALREAKNADAFLGPAAEILGCPIEVVDGEREAALVFRAVRE